MRKIPKNVIIVAFIAGAFFMVSFLNEGTAQLVYLISVLLCGTLLLKNGLEMAGGPELIIGVGVEFGPVCSKILAESGAVGSLSKIINAVLRFSLGKLGVTRTVEVGPESSVTLAFFIIFAIAAALREPHTAMEVQRGPSDPEFKEKNYVEKSRGSAISLPSGFGPLTGRRIGTTAFSLPSRRRWRCASGASGKRSSPIC